MGEGDAAPPATAPQELLDVPLDEMFGLLQNERRRRVLHYLDGRDTPVSISDLSEQIAAWENDKPVSQVSSDERKRVYVGLYQAHLPKMDGLDVIEFDKPRGTIERGANADQFYTYLERIEDRDGDIPWHRYYAGLSVLGVVALALALWLQPLTRVPVTAIVAGTVVTAFVVCSATHFWWEKTDA